MTAPRRLATAALALALAAPFAPARADDPPATPDPALRAAVDSDARDPRLAAFDASRHPVEALTFFGVKPGMTVVEVWPAGGYWAEILAPYLREGGGTLVAALEAQPAGSPAREAAVKRDGYFRRRMGGNPELAGIRLAAFGPEAEALAPPSTVDVVLSVHDLHQWMRQGFAQEALVDCYNALKPGGVLALIDHRGNRAGEQDIHAADGYVRQDFAQGLAELAGFEFVASSEMAANPKDTASWPHGVTTLAPTFALGKEDRAKYEAVGEPDDFVLKFRKPER